MLRDREIQNYGLKTIGQTWTVSKGLGSQLISQGFAEEVSTEVHTVKKEERSTIKKRVVKDGT